MTRFLVTTALVASLSTLALAAPPAGQTQSDQTQPQQTDNQRQQAGNQGQQAGSTDLGQVAQADDKTSGSIIRASEIIGMDIHDARGEEIGEVNDIVLDASTGEVRYAAVSYGGFLGLGDKLFAVPWAAFKYRQASDADEHHLVLNVTEQQLEGAQGFNQDQWPNFADQQFASDLNKRYGVKVRTGYRGVDVDVDAPQQGQPQQQPQQGQPQQQPQLEDQPQEQPQLDAPELENEETPDAINPQQ